MNIKPAVVLFFNDWEVHPGGINAGGGESATVALARAIASLGYRVIACANLPEGECVYEGIEFWNFGPDYALHDISRRLRDLPAFHCLAATLVHPFLHLRDHANCLSRIVINHSPSPTASGIEPATAMHVIDYMLCVSHMQRSVLLSRKTDPEKIKVVRNGFDPEIFTYAGPEGRDWNQLVFIGRVEAPKGIHVLLQVFGELKGEFPDLKLSIFGDESYWPEFTSHKHDLIRKLPGLRFHGKVPQRELAEHLRTAGLLVFPSQSFETAGLAVVDAQASGCPVVANGVGGVPEYVVEKELGDIVYDRSANGLREAIARLLRDRPRLISMSKAAEKLGRQRPWKVVADEVMSWAERAADTRLGLPWENLPDSILRIKQPHFVPPSEVLAAHEVVAGPEGFTQVELDVALERVNWDAWPHLVAGFKLENQGNFDQALEAYRHAAERTTSYDWQPFFRLALLHAERNEIPLARIYAKKVIEREPQFPLRSNLERLISLAQD
jgi:glycosyltransferase involved in cell wall biosynthesis